MNKKILIIFCFVGALSVASFIFFRYAVNSEFITEKGNAYIIRVFEPLAGAEVESPLTIRGEARGSWYFEASFPVRLLDANSKEIAVKAAQAKSEWMTENFVPFEITLEFSKPATKTGFLVLKKDNPSGLPEHDDELRFPVQFK